MNQATVLRSLVAAAIAVPATVGALPLCYDLVENCSGCGGSGSASVCDFRYELVSVGGQQFNPSMVRDKICTSYPFGSHTTTPCDEPPPTGFKRTECPSSDGSNCCDVTGMGTIQVIGTITAPGGAPCLGPGTGG